MIAIAVSAALRAAPLLFPSASPETIPDLAPLAFARFCALHPGECEPSGNRQPRFVVTPPIHQQLDGLNRAVNGQILPDGTASGPGPVQVWAIAPTRGDCNAYALTKRHVLALMGYPTSLLLLTAVRTPAGENHMVLVIPAEGGDLTLDNLTDAIKPFGTTGYTMLKQQSAANPKLWLKPL